MFESEARRGSITLRSSQGECQACPACAEHHRLQCGVERVGKGVDRYTCQPLQCHTPQPCDERVRTRSHSAQKTQMPRTLVA